VACTLPPLAKEFLTTGLTPFGVTGGFATHSPGVFLYSIAKKRLKGENNGVVTGSNISLLSIISTLFTTLFTAPFVAT